MTTRSFHALLCLIAITVSCGLVGCGGGSRPHTPTLTPGTVTPGTPGSAYQQDPAASVSVSSDNCPGGSCTITITGYLTRFVQGATTVDFGPGITVGAVTVNSPTSATVQVQIAQAAPGLRQIVVSTNGHRSSATFQVPSSGFGPVANAGPQQSAAVGRTVELDGSHSTCTSSNGSCLLGFQWSFLSVPTGSGAQLSNPGDPNPIFTVDKAGNYILQLAASGSTQSVSPANTAARAAAAVPAASSAGSASTLASVVITTGDTSPVANAGPGQLVNVSDTVHLDGSASSDADGDKLTYQWALLSAPPGSIAALSDATSVAPTFVADKAGAYQLQLTVNDGHGNSASDTVQISTNNDVPPIADAGADQQVAAGNTVQLDGSQSSAADPHDNDKLTYAWSFTFQPTNSSTATLSAANIAKPTFVPDVPGAYGLQLVVTDTTTTPNLNSTPATVMITTDSNSIRPVAVAGKAQAVPMGTTVQLDGSGSTGAPTTYLWSLLSTPAGSKAALSDATQSKPAFVADLPGFYVAQLIVADSSLTSYPSTVSIQATVPGITFSPNAVAFGNQTAGQTSNSQPVVITNTGTGELTITDLQITGANVSDFFPPTAASLPVKVPPNEQTTVNVTFTPRALGSRTANLTVTDNAPGSPHAVVLSGTGVAGLPTSVTAATSSTPQSVAINSAFAPLQVTVKDARDFPVSGVTVTFTAPASGSGASGTFAGGNTATTNADGVATAPTFTANGTAGQYTVTATVSGLTSVSFSLTNLTGSPHSIVTTAGTPQNVVVKAAFAPLQVTVKDTGGNLLNGVTVTFAAPTSGASGTFAGGVNTATTNAQGVATAPTFTANSVAGQYSVTASVAGVATPASFLLTNTAGPATRLSVSAPGSATAGTAISFTVTALDASNNTVSGYNGTVNFTSSDTQAVLPANATLTNGTGTFSATLKTAGTQTLTATDTVHSTIAGTSNNLTVGAGAVTHLSVSAPGSATAGTAISFTVTALDASNNTVSGYTGTVHFTSSDAQAVLPANTTLTNGTGTFSATLKTAGTQTLTATDTVHSTIAGTSNNLTVGAGAATHLSVSAPGSATAGAAISFTVTALDTGNNTVSGYTGTVHFTSSDAQAVLPANTTLTNGTGTLSATLKTAGPQTLTATDTVTNSITGTSINITVGTGVAASVTATAGTPQSATISQSFATALQATVKDAYGNPVSGATVTFAAPATGASGTFANGTNTTTATTNTQGIATASTFTANSIANIAGPYTVTATVSGVASSASFLMTNLHGSPTSIAATSGNGQSVVVNNSFVTLLQATVKDASGNPVSGVVVTFTAPSGSVASGTFTGGGRTATASTDTTGVATAVVFSANSIAGQYSVTASVAGVSTPASFSLTNTAGPATRLSVSAPGSATAGTAISFTVTALDASNNTVSGYTGTVNFTSSDTQAVLPANATLTNGTGTFSATLKTAGTQTLTATDTVHSTIAGTSNNLTVGAGAVTHLSVSAPGSATAGTAISFTVTALDASNNTVSGYTGTVHFTSSDAQAVLPANTTLTNGTGTFSATLKTAGTQTLTATDTVHSTIAGTSNNLTVGAGAATHLSVSAPGSATAGAAISFTVTALDTGNNTVSGYTGTVHFTSSDAQAVLPANTTLTNGTGTLSATLKTAGPQTLTATDTVTNSITGTSINITVGTGVAASVTATAGTPQSATISQSFATALQATVKDAYGNPVSGATVTFAAPATGASGTFANGTNTTTATTNTQGIATASTFTANSIANIAGPYTVTATVSGVASSASFLMTNLHGSPTSIAATSGNGQSVVVNNSFVTLLQATVKDASGNPVSGVVVTFTAPSGSVASGTFTGGGRTATASTDTTGVATAVVFSANSIAGQYSVTASVAGVSTPASFSLTNTAGPLSKLVFTTTPFAVAAGVCSGQVTVQAQDQYNNPVTTGTGGITIGVATSSSSSGKFYIGNSCGGSAVTTVSIPNGSTSVSFSYQDTAFGTPTLTASSGSISGTQKETISAASISQFAVVAPASAVAGTPISVTVTAQDSFGNTVTGYTGTVHFTFGTSDTGATSTNYTFSSADNGSKALSFTLTTAASGQTIGASDTSSHTGTSGNINVSAAGTTHLVVAAQGPATAGSAFNFTVTAKDTYNNTVSGYTGTVHFTSSDAQAVLPANYTFTMLDQGVHVFSGVTLKTAGTQTVTATDTVASSITGSSGGITVNAGAATHFVVNASSPATAGSAFSFTVTAQDAYNNTATGYSGTVHFTSSDGQAVLPADSTLTNGARTFSATLKTTGAQTITATDTVTNSITATSNSISVSAGAATHFTVSAPTTTTSGVTFNNLVVTALDASNNTVSGYTGTVHFTSSDTQAVLPANTTLTNGTGTFSATLKTAGTQTITATDTTNSITATSNSISVSAGSATHFTVSAPTTATAGVAFNNLVVTALDASNNTVTSYSGTVHFISSDGQAVLPADSTLTNGARTFSATLKSAGTQTITATDTTNSITATSNISVSAGSATHFTVSAPTTATAGVAFNNLVVTALDASNNTVTSYSGTVHFISSDGQAVLPANSTLTNGARTFSATLKTAGTQTITATDTVTNSITATSNSISVSAGSATHFTVSAPTTATAGVAFNNLVVTALDASNNTVTSYSGTVHFISSDGQAVLPADSTLTNGARTFSATLKTAGAQTITATDMVTNSITATSNSISVSAGSATHFTVSAPTTTTSGVAFNNLVVTAKDANNNTVTSYTGTVHFTSSDGQAVLPANTTLTNGTVTFSATLKTVGAQTITATDTVTNSITATSNSISVSAGSATHFTVSAPTTTTSGVAFNNLVVTALDASNNTVSGYTGTVHFTSSDTQAVLPANTTLTNGTGTFSATLKTAGAQTITATDTVTNSITATSNNITVGVGAVTHLSVSAPGTATAGTSFSFTVTALDAGNNTVSGYSGTVHFTSSDTQAGAGAGLPIDAKLSNGVGGFAAILKTAGPQTITATDTVTNSITGTSSNITVSHGAGVVTATAGTPQSVAISQSFATALQATVKDAYGNPVSGVTVTFTAPGSGLPSGTFAGATNSTTANTNTNGIATAPVFTANSLAGSYTVTATITGGTPASFSLTNLAGSAHSIAATPSSKNQSAWTNSAFALPLQATVTDASGNPVSGITVTFTAPAAGSGASGTFAGGNTATANTDTNGIATAPTFTANSFAGSYTVTATATGITTPASFSLTNNVQPTLLMPPVSVGANLEVPVTVGLNAPAASNLTVTITSPDSSKVLLSLDPTLVGTGNGGTSSVPITIYQGTDGNAFARVYVQSLDVPTGATPDTIQLTVTAPGYAPLPVTVTLTPSALVLNGGNGYGQNFSTQTQSVPLTVAAYGLDSSLNIAGSPQMIRGGLNPSVNVSSGDTTIGTISGTAALAGGNPYASGLSFQPGNVGSTLLTVTQPSGFSTPASGDHLTATVGQPQILLTPMTVGYQMQVTGQGQLSDPAPTGGLVVTIKSDTPGTVLLSTSATLAGSSSITVTVPAGTTALPTFYVQGVAIGSGQLEASAASYSFNQVQNNGTVTVQHSAFLLAGPSQVPGQAFSTTAYSTTVDTPLLLTVWQLDSKSNPVQQGQIAGGVTVSVSVVSGTPAVGTIVPIGTATFNGGDSINTTLSFHPLTQGTSALSVTASGFTGGLLTATVGPPQITLNMPAGTTIGNLLELSATGSLNTAAPSGGLNITITSSNSSVRLSNSATQAGSSSITVTVPQFNGLNGARFPQFYVQSMASSGSATLTASDPNNVWLPGTITVNLSPSGFVLVSPLGMGQDFATNRASGNTQLTVQAMQLDASNAPQRIQALAGGVNESVSVSSGNTGVGTIVTSPVAISGGLTSGTTSFTPVGSGTSLLTVSPPTGFVTPGSGSTLHAVVH